MAKQAGLTEDLVAMIDDGWDASALPPRLKTALRWADAFLGDPGGVTDAMRDEMSRAFSPAEIVELTAALALFMGFSKIAIVLGQEPESMPTTVVPTPGFPDPA